MALQFFALRIECAVVNFAAVLLRWIAGRGFCVVVDCVATDCVAVNCVAVNCGCGGLCGHGAVVNCVAMNHAALGGVAVNYMAMDCLTTIMRFYVAVYCSAVVLRCGEMRSGQFIALRWRLPMLYWRCGGLFDNELRGGEL